MGHIVYLDSEDDVASARAKLDAFRADVAAISIPPDSFSLRNPISIRLLARQADHISLDLSVISSDAFIRRLAQQEGLLTFGSARSYERYEASRQVRRFTLGSFVLTARRTLGLILGVGLVAGLLVGLAALAYLFIPSTTVRLTPATTRLSDTMEFSADASLRDIDYDGRRIPARSINLVIEASDQGTVSGQEQSSGGRAEGQVTFMNRTAQSVVVPAGTLVTTADGIRFATLGELAVPGAEGATGQVGVVAVDAGAQGNVARLQVNRIEGGLANQVAVLNEEPTRGGGVGSVTVVSPADQQRLREQLLERIGQDARAQLREQLKEGELLPESSISLLVLGEEFDHEVDDEAPSLGLHIKARASALIFFQDDVTSLLRRAWHPALPPGFFVDVDSIEAGAIQTVESRGSVVALSIPISGVAVARVDAGRVVDEVRGKTGVEAVAILDQTLILAHPPEVTIEPSWAERAMRVSVVVQPEPAP